MLASFVAKITTTLYGDLALLPLQPERPVRESLEWLTDVIESHDSTEDPVPLRSIPRQSFTYTMPVSPQQFARTFNTERGALRKDWAVPIWTEAQYVGTVAAAATSVACNTVLYDIRIDGLVMLYKDADHYEVLEVASLDSGSIDPVDPVVSSYLGAWLVPVRVGWIPGNIAKEVRGYNGKSKIKFELEDALNLVPEAPTQYLGNDIYYDATLIEGSIARFFSQQIDIVDGELGNVYRRSTWDRARYGSPYKSQLRNATEMRAFKNWLYRRAGRYRSFWLPTFEINLRCANVGNIVSTLYATRDSYIDYGSDRTHIAIEDTAGNWYPRVISSPVHVSGDRVQLTLSSALNIDAGRIKRISYLGLNRLDTDAIEIDWIGNNVAESEFAVLELSP